MKSEGGKALKVLAPGVRQALSSLEAVPEPDPASWARRRDVFLAEVRVAAEHTRASTPRPAARSTTLPAFGVRSRHSPMTALARALLVCLLIAGGMVGTVTASQYSLPGSVLYPVKLHIEDWQLALTQRPEAEAQLALHMAQKRVDEALTLAKQDADIPDQVATRYERQLTRALEATDRVTGPSKAALETEFRAAITQQLQATEKLMQRKGESVTAEPDAVQVMVRTMEMANARIGVPGLGSEDPPPPHQEQHQVCATPTAELEATCTPPGPGPAEPNPHACECPSGGICTCEDDPGAGSGPGPGSGNDSAPQPGPTAAPGPGPGGNGHGNGQGPRPDGSGNGSSGNSDSGSNGGAAGPGR